MVESLITSAVAIFRGNSVSIRVPLENRNYASVASYSSLVITRTTTRRLHFWKRDSREWEKSDAGSFRDHVAWESCLWGMNRRRHDGSSTRAFVRGPRWAKRSGYDHGFGLYPRGLHGRRYAPATTNVSPCSKPNGSRLRVEIVVVVGRRRLDNSDSTSWRACPDMCTNGALEHGAKLGQIVRLADTIAAIGPLTPPPTPLTCGLF